MINRTSSIRRIYNSSVIIRESEININNNNERRQ